MSVQKPDPKNILLVCSPLCTRVEGLLVQAGCHVTKVAQAITALERIKHDVIDDVILISTGSEMDVTETALNLRDVNPSVEIIILIADRQTIEDTTPGNDYHQLCNTKNQSAHRHSTRPVFEIHRMESKASGRSIFDV